MTPNETHEAKIVELGKALRRQAAGTWRRVRTADRSESRGHAWQFRPTPDATTRFLRVSHAAMDQAEVAGRVQLPGDGSFSGSEGACAAPGQGSATGAAGADGAVGPPGPPGPPGSPCGPQITAVCFTPDPVNGGVNVVVNFPPGGTVIMDNESSARRLASEITRLIRTELRSQRALA